MLLALAAPPLSSLPVASLPAFCFAPLLAWLIRTETPARSAWLGLAAGVGFGALALRFTFDVLGRFAGIGTLFALPLFLLLLVLQSVPLMLALFIARLSDTRVSTRLPWTLPLAIAGAFGVVPVLFPWHVGHFTLPWLTWAQLAELGGLPLLDLVTAFVGCFALAALQLRVRGRLKQAGAFALGAALLVALAVGFGRMRRADIAVLRATAPALRVGVVQPDVSIRALRDGLTARERLTRLESLSQEAVRQGAELVLWPEAAYPISLSRDALLAREPGTLSLDGHAVPHVVGAISRDLADASGCRRWNSLVAIEADGQPSGHVDKRERFPFAEYIPFWNWFPWLQARYPCPGEQVGEGDPVLVLAGTLLGLLNCYEEVGPARARAATRAGAELLLSFSNDAWFGRSMQPELHRVVSRFRAIETRRDVLRAVNTGGSSHVAATGEELRVLPRHQPGWMVTEARRLTVATLSVGVGRWLPLLSLGFLVVLGARPVARWRAARQSLNAAG